MYRRLFKGNFKYNQRLVIQHSE